MQGLDGFSIWCIVVSSNGFSGIGRVVRGGFWLYGSRIVNNFSGFIYWMIISALAGSEVLGLTSATVGLAGLINGLLSLGIGTGLRRFLGRCIGLGDRGCLSRYLWTTVLFTAIVYVSTGSLLYVLGSLGYSLWSYSPEMLRIASIMVLLGVSQALSAFLVSLLRTDILFFGTIAGNVLKFVVGVGLVYLGFGWVGAAVGYMFIGLTNFFVSLVYALRVIGFRLEFSIGALVDVLRAGIVSWLPGIVVLAGQWLGVLFVFGSSGAVETGYYYVAYSISNVVLGVSTSMLGLLLPVLSGMGDGRKRVAHRVLRISLLFMVPIAVFIGVYPWLPLGLLGSEYVAASNTLVMLLLGSVPLAITMCISSLVYAYGYYRMVLFIGLSQNIPRIILYFILVPLYGGFGAALSFTAGSYFGLLSSALIAHYTRFHLDIPSIIHIVTIPLTLGLISNILGLHWIIGLIIISCFACTSVFDGTFLSIITPGEISTFVPIIFPGRIETLIDMCVLSPITAPNFSIGTLTRSSFTSI